MDFEVDPRPLRLLLYDGRPCFDGGGLSSSEAGGGAMVDAAVWPWPVTPGGGGRENEASKMETSFSSDEHKACAAKLGSEGLPVPSTSLNCSGLQQTRILLQTTIRVAYNVYL